MLYFKSSRKIPRRVKKKEKVHECIKSAQKLQLKVKEYEPKEDRNISPRQNHQDKEDTATEPVGAPAPLPPWSPPKPSQQISTINDEEKKRNGGRRRRKRR